MVEQGLPVNGHIGTLGMTKKVVDRLFHVMTLMVGRAKTQVWDDGNDPQSLTGPRRRSVVAPQCAG